MTYKIDFRFDRTLARDVTKETPLSQDPAICIHVTATVSDASGEAVPGQILQFFTEPPNLILQGVDENTIEYENDYGSYLLSDDGAGNYEFWLYAYGKALVETGFVVLDDPDSEVEGATVFFSSYTGLTTKYGPPDLPVDSDGIIQIDGNEAFIKVGLPLSTRPFLEYANAHAALLVNGTQFVSDTFSRAFNEGFRVPTNMLDTTKLNRFGYTLMNGAASTSPIAPQVPVNGEVVSRPTPSELRTLISRPYLLNNAQVINDASKAVSVYIDCPRNSADNFEADDKINITVYINGWKQASNVPNNTILQLTEITLADGDLGGRVHANMLTAQLAGFGMNASGVPGTIFIDYTLTKNGQTKVSAMPQRYFSGLINTVGPI